MLFNQLTNYTEQGGRTGEAMAYAQQLINLEPWQESAHRAVMRLLVQTGQRTAAIVQYQQLQKSLQEELGIEPDRETVGLYEQIKDGHYVPAPDPFQPGYLPATMTPLIGREQEQLVLQEMLYQPQNRLITIVGPGGVGKTRLALAVAENIRSDFTNGVWFIDLATLADNAAGLMNNEARLTSRMVMVIAAALGIPFTGSQPPKVQLLAALKNRECLLLLDNFETALAGASLVYEILQATTNVVIFATSREPLQFQAEHIYRLTGLLTPSATTAPEDIIAYESVILFQTTMARAGTRLTAEELPTIAEICRFLDGIPLGIELAASWTARIDLARILTTLQTQYVRLESVYQDLPARHRNMEAVFGGSWRMLSPAQQTALAQAAVFRGGFTKEAANEIIRTSSRNVVSLVDKSLLRLEANGRYSIHDLLRQFSAVKLSEQHEARATAGRHSHYYLGYLAERTAALWQQTPQHTLAELHHEFENIYTGWQTAVQAGLFELLARSLSGLTTYYARKGLFHEGVQVLTKSIAVIEADEVGKAHRLWGWLQVELARLLAPVAQFEEAREGAQKGLFQAEELGDPVLKSWSQFRLARTLWMQGHYEACYPLLEAALATAQAAEMEQLEAECWQALSALADTHGGNFALAVERGQKALARFQQAGNSLGELRALILLGNCSWGLGDYSLAQNYYEQALQLCRLVSSHYDEAAALANLGTVLREQGAFEQAKDYYQSALRQFGELRDQRRAFITLQNVSLLYNQMGQPDLALDFGQQALKVARELDTRSGESQPLCCIGHALLSLHRPGEAAAAYVESLTLHREVGNHHLAMEPLAGLVGVALAQNDLPEAMRLTEEILAHMVHGTLHGTGEPIRVQWTAYLALTAVHDPRAKDVLAAAYGSLMERAGKISDPSRQQSFLHNIPAHFKVQKAMASGAGINLIE
jgi:predicted ATPase/Tfp pilus assembly protein PilF